MQQSSTPQATTQLANPLLANNEQLIAVSAKDIVKQHLDKLGIPQDIQIDDAEFAEKKTAHCRFVKTA